MNKQTSLKLTKSEIENVADCAAEHGEHAIVAACQVLLSSYASEEELRDARRQVRAYIEAIQGY